MLVKYLLNEDSIDSTMEEYLYENYMDGLTFNAKGQLLLTEESASAIQSKIEEFLERESDKLKDVKKSAKKDIDVAYWAPVFGLGMYLLGAALTMIAMTPIPVIAGLIAFLSSIIVTIFMNKFAHTKIAELKNAKSKIKSFKSKLKGNEKLLDKLEALEEHIDDALNYADADVKVLGGGNESVEYDDEFIDFELEF